MDRELSDVAKAIYFTVLDKLCLAHFHTALDIAQTGTIIAVVTIVESSDTMDANCPGAVQ